MMDPNRLAQRPSHSVARIERRVRILEHDLDRAAQPAPIRRAQALIVGGVDAADLDRTGRGCLEPDKAATEGRLSGTRLSHEPHALPAVERHRDVAQRTDLDSPTLERLGHLAHRDQRLIDGLGRRCRLGVDGGRPALPDHLLSDLGEPDTGTLPPILHLHQGGSSLPALVGGP